MQQSEQYSLKSIDNRSQQQQQIQRKFAENLHRRNLQTLKIRLTNKSKIKYSPSLLRRMELENGWYCHYTDNKINSKKTIVAMHGGPGNHIQYAGLQTQMKGYCRWINIVVPGMDGQDERRGNYDGSFSHFSQMIVKLLAKLQIPKVILCSHSFSSTFSPLLITKYPEIFEGYIIVAGVKQTWNTAFMSMYQLILVSQKYYTEQNQKLKPWQHDSSRLKMHQRFLQLHKNINVDEKELPTLTLTQFFAFLKLINKPPQIMDGVFQINKNLQLLRVFADGRNDPYCDNRQTQRNIFNLVNSQDSYINQPYFRKLFSRSKNLIQQRLHNQFGVNLQGDKIQQYLCFYFEDTGHTVHRRRPCEIAQILKIYIACLEEIDKVVPLIQPSL